MSVAQKESAMVVEEKIVQLHPVDEHNLELETNLAGGREHTLAWVMDRTATPMGAVSDRSTAGMSSPSSSPPPATVTTVPGDCARRWPGEERSTRALRQPVRNEK